MHKLADFLRSEYKAIIVSLCSVAVFGLIFAFANLNKEYFILGAEIIAFSDVIYLFIQYFNYEKRGRPGNCREIGGGKQTIAKSSYK